MLTLLPFIIFCRMPPRTRSMKDKAKPSAFAKACTKEMLTDMRRRGIYDAAKILGLVDEGGGGLLEDLLLYASQHVCKRMEDRMKKIHADMQ